MHSDARQMNSETRLQKSKLVTARRAVLVIAVLVAWTVALAAIMRDREPEGSSRVNPGIEKPTKPYYKFLEQAPV